MTHSHILLLCVAFSSFACLFIYCISVLVKCWLLFCYYSSLHELNSCMKYVKKRNKRANGKIWYLVSGCFCLLLFFCPRIFSPILSSLKQLSVWACSLKGQSFGLEICVSSPISVYLALNFYQLGVSLIDRGLQLSLLAYFIAYVTSPFMYYAFCFCLLLVILPKLCGLLRTGID